MSHFAEKLALLRESMRVSNIDVYLISSSDPHLGEYVPDHWRIIEWLTGFTGSAAKVIVTDTFAGLWSDSRYFIQAEIQLRGSGFVLMKPKESGLRDLVRWLTENVREGAVIGMDGRIFSVSEVRLAQKLLKEKTISLDTDCDLISDLWPDRPPMPVSMAFDHPVVFCGIGREAKISEVRNRMRVMGVDYHLLTSLDDIAWLLNIRGFDLKYSPLLTSCAIIDMEQILLLVDESKIPLKLAMEFDRSGIVMLPYEETGGMLSTLPEEATILITPETTSVAFINNVPGGMRVVEDFSIPTRLKAIKNRIEIENIGKVMIKDGVALTRFFFWLEQNISSSVFSELSITEKLNSYRSEQENYLSPSFSTIAAYNAHGALPHYSATNESDSVIEESGILLIDSGGQYLDGTTDITRTIALGMPTAQQRQDFTMVLKGTINLAMAKFPSGTKGFQLDILARMALWERGLNYGHGTGHGVGFCLNVHEGPQSIGPGDGAGSKTVIEPGMLISDEPAIYREGEYGIRIENLILCYEDEETEFGKFLRFETMSLCYIDKSLIDITLLNESETGWLNAYHTEVYESLSPHLTPEEDDWLKDKTSAV
jgi:Xaa-Pro aminopeptidase